MDRQVNNLMSPVSIMQKWKVKNATQTKRGAGIGWTMGKLQPEHTFFGSWIVNGWVKDNDHPWWVKVYDCVKVVSDEPADPPETGTDSLYWLKSDYQLVGTRYNRARTKFSAGHPQTMRFAHHGSGVAKANDDYIELTMALNPGMTYELFVKMMDAFMPARCKWRDGDKKVAFEIQFASNTIAVLRQFRNGGGLSGIAYGAPLYEADTLDFDNLPTRVEDVSQKHIIHFTVSRVGSKNVNPPPFMGGREVEPRQPTRLLFASSVPLYFQTELGIPVRSFQNQYYPEWEPAQDLA